MRDVKIATDIINNANSSGYCLNYAGCKENNRLQSLYLLECIALTMRDVKRIMEAMGVACDQVLP